MSTPLSQEYFDEKIANLASATQLKKVADDLTTVRTTLEDVRLKVDVILEVGVVRQEFRKLVRELQDQGIKINESRVFSA